MTGLKAEHIEQFQKDVAAGTSAQPWGAGRGGVARGAHVTADPSLVTAEREERVRLRREVSQFRLERDILSKAAACFARETGTILSGCSGS